MKELWVEKYRPKSLEGYVFKDEQHRATVNKWLKEKTIPHVLLSGSPGTGKTTLAKAVLTELGISDFDIMEINASRERGIDEVRERVTDFISKIPFGPFKVVLMDEADRLTAQAQDAMKGVIEEYSDHARFIFTCNSPNKIVPALHSRFQQLHFSNIDKTEYTARVATILMEENVAFDLDLLDTFVKSAYPDLRKCINLVQQHTIDNVLTKPAAEESGMADYKVAMVDLFKAGKVSEARKLLCGKARPDEMEDIYRWLYDNIDLFGNEEQQNKAILIIKQGLVDHTLVIDPEINLAATLIRLAKV